MAGGVKPTRLIRQILFETSSGGAGNVLDAMTRGNQRDTDRARAQARQAKQTKSTGGGNPLAKREADAKALQEKIARKAAMKAEGGDANANANANKGKKDKGKKK